jgi:hypothetical protein
MKAANGEHAVREAPERCMWNLQRRRFPLTECELKYDGKYYFTYRTHNAESTSATRDIDRLCHGDIPVLLSDGIVIVRPFGIWRVRLRFKGSMRIAAS